MRILPLWIGAAAICGLPLVAAAHTGGALDAEGCHADHRKGNYHCHRGEAAGYTFPNRAAMLEAVSTGKFPEKTVEEEGFFEKLWPFGSKHEQEKNTGNVPATPPAPVESPAPPAAPDSGATAPPAGAAPASPSASAPAASPAKPSTPAAAATPGAAAAPAAPMSEHEKRLKVLQGLYEMGLISREEYEAKRKEILDQL
jgi:hypothetical protein